MAASPPKLLYLVTEDWYFLSHRVPMALAAQRAGYEVHVATNVDADGEAIKAYGFELHPVPWRRGSMNPFYRLDVILRLRRLYRDLRPALAHHVALEPSVMGSMAAIGLPVICLNALAGLGFAFTSRTAKARVSGSFARLLLRNLLRRRQNSSLVQNADDRATLIDLGIDSTHIFTIAGSGVDVDYFKPMPEPKGPITAAFVGRLLDDKGVRTLIAAHEILRRQGRPVRLLLAGDPDPANPASISLAEIERWKQIPDVAVLGHVDDISSVWAAAHIAVLPSRREGLPKSLLEAAACGRPIVATDVPGCREIARQDVNALLVPADDANALADAISRLAQDADLRHRFGVQGRVIVEREFSDKKIGADIVALYGRLLSR